MGLRMLVVPASCAALIGQWERNPGVFFAFSDRFPFVAKERARPNNLVSIKKTGPIPNSTCRGS